MANKRLFKVTVRGFKYTYNVSYSYRESYVVAEDPDEALEKVQEGLLKLNVGDSFDREMEKIELIAEGGTAYPKCGIFLYD